MQGLIVGVTTKSPNSGQLPQNLSDIYSHDQYWWAEIKSNGCTAHRKGQCRSLQWNMDCSAGNKFGCKVLETGELYLCYNERDVVLACEGLPANKPLWGFVYLSGWKVEASYVIARGLTHCDMQLIGCVCDACESYIFYISLLALCISCGR